jgi:flavin reductase (DIM6/NTAB) family NADH-FMN oxidoreductase RutF
MPHFDASTLGAQDQYKLLIGSVTPRPIALVTSIGPDGPNAAPFSFFNCIGAPPPMVQFSVGEGARGAKDTLRNIQETPEFVVHIVSDSIRNGMNITAIDFPRGVNEIERAGFTSKPGVRVRAPVIAEAPIAMECRLMQILQLGSRPYHLIIGEVVHFHYHEGILDERYRVDVSKVNPIGRLAGKGGYARITDRFEMPRLGLDGKPAGE